MIFERLVLYAAGLHILWKRTLLWKKWSKKRALDVSNKTGVLPQPEFVLIHQL